jgi:hypothetical protein
MADDEAVTGIARWTGENPYQPNPGPRRTEPRKDLEHSVRLCADRLVVDQNNAGQPASAPQVIFNYSLTGRRLLRGEAENAGRVVLDYESDPGIAQIADPVEQDDWCLCPGYDRLKPLAEPSRARTSAKLSARDSPKHCSVFC